MSETTEQPSILDALHGMHPQIANVAGIYATAYPHDKTSHEVLDAVTVAVPLRMFMVMAAVATQVLQEHAGKVPS